MLLQRHLLRLLLVGQVLRSQERCADLKRTCGACGVRHNVVVDRWAGGGPCGRWWGIGGGGVL